MNLILILLFIWIKFRCHNFKYQMSFLAWLLKKNMEQLSNFHNGYELH